MVSVRFLQYVRILKESGEVDFDESWGYAHSTQLPSDTGVVCDWSDVTPGSLELPDCAKATCSGHKYEDELPFKDLITDQDGLFTNGDFYHHVTSPFSSRLPYAYDTLTSWPGCPTGVLY